MQTPNIRYNELTEPILIKHQLITTYLFLLICTYVYLNLDTPYSACGCYHFESNGKDLFTSINGLESTVMGLAMEHLIEKLNQLGVIEL